ncbi:hypothetical protein NL676_036225 [Syzygium grande]|nr:hypothetical protein NL676_036225 [Syzygium grande]
MLEVTKVGCACGTCDGVQSPFLTGFSGSDLPENGKAGGGVYFVQQAAESVGIALTNNELNGSEVGGEPMRSVQLASPQPP